MRIDTDVHKYEINMHTDLGIRNGFLRLCTAGDTLEGELELLNRIEPVHGKIDTEGNCQLWGNLVTLGHVMKYLAMGQMTEHAIHLVLQCGKSAFFISGTAEGNEGQTHA